MKVSKEIVDLIKFEEEVIDPYWDAVIEIEAKKLDKKITKLYDPIVVIQEYFGGNCFGRILEIKTKGKE